MFSNTRDEDDNEIRTLYPNAVHASHRDCMIPRSWKDLWALSPGSISAGLLDRVVSDGSRDNCREGFFACSGIICFLSVDVVCFTFFDGTLESLCDIPSALLFLTWDILGCLENAPFVLQRSLPKCSQNFSALALSLYFLP